MGRVLQQFRQPEVRDLDARTLVRRDRESGANGDSFLRSAVQGTEDFVNALSELPGWVDNVAFSLGGVTAVLREASNAAISAFSPPSTA